MYAGDVLVGKREEWGVERRWSGNYLYNVRKFLTDINANSIFFNFSSLSLTTPQQPHKTTSPQQPPQQEQRLPKVQKAFQVLQSKEKFKRLLFCCLIHKVGGVPALNMGHCVIKLLFIYFQNFSFQFFYVLKNFQTLKNSSY